MTSRPNNEDISKTFGTESQITMTASEWDLRRYVTERIGEQEGRALVGRLEPELKENIISTVSSGAAGMYEPSCLYYKCILD